MPNDPSEILMIVVSSLGRQVPMLIVWAIMFVVALVKWSQHPRASMLTVMAVVVSLGASTLGSIAFPLLPRFMDVANISWAFMGLSIFLSMLHGLAWLLLLAAIYSGRQPDRQRGNPYGSKPPAPQGGGSPF